MVNNSHITWFLPGACLLGILGYFIMMAMISYSYWISLAPDALGQMDYIYGSAIPYFYWIIALVGCFIPQATIRCYLSLWKPSVTQRLHRQMLKMKGATPSSSPKHSGNGGSNDVTGAVAAIDGHNGNGEKAINNHSRSHHTPPPQPSPMSRNEPAHVGINGIPSTPSEVVHRSSVVSIAAIPPSSSSSSSSAATATATATVPTTTATTNATIPPSPIRAH
jgi:hypothetical protein